MIRIHLPSQVSKVINLLETAGYEAFAVGGCVRDRLMGKSPKDFDVTTDATPDEIKNIFFDYKVIETGIEHGTVTVISDDLPIEITTYRIDFGYSDGRHPDSVSFTESLEKDLARRDFTVNAMAYSPRGGFADFFGGKYDIQNKILRCVGNADRRFKEDALRILRALRFASVLSFEIEENTRNAIIKNKELLTQISKERIAAELVKLLCGKDACKVLREYRQVISVFIPEIEPSFDFNQHNPYHIYDVYEHTICALGKITREPELRLAALFHDIGKPRCYSIDNKNIGHFYGHPIAGAEMTEQILDRLKFGNNTKKTVKKLVYWHDLRIEQTDKSIKRALNKLGATDFFKLIYLQRADNLAQNPDCWYRQRHHDIVEKMAREILKAKDCFTIKYLAIDGNDLMEMGMEQGKQIGKTLNALLMAVIDGKVKNEKNVLIDYMFSNKSVLPRSATGTNLEISPR